MLKKKKGRVIKYQDHRIQAGGGTGIKTRCRHCEHYKKQKRYRRDIRGTYRRGLCAEGRIKQCGTCDKFIGRRYGDSGMSSMRGSAGANKGAA